MAKASAAVRVRTPNNGNPIAVFKDERIPQTPPLTFAQLLDQHA
jgi:hypothetical protein